MGFTNTLAHNLLNAYTYKDYFRYIGNSENPLSIQKNYLFALTKENSKTLFGQKHKFSQIATISDFQSNVPLSQYEDYQFYIDRIAEGKPSVLTNAPVFKLVPTSGTSGFSKFIPYTKNTVSEFNLALNVWMHSLYREFPALKRGRAFWLISPQGGMPELKSVVPVGFASDDSYFGKIGSWLINRTMVLPPEIQKISSATNHKYLSCLYLLGASDLNLISVWNPTYLTELLNYIAYNKSHLINAMITGIVTLPDVETQNLIELFKIPKNEILAKRLNNFIVEGNITETSWHKIWPQLQLISCWTNAWAAPRIPTLQNLFKKTIIQGKGLLATEGAVTIPINGNHLPAYHSHFFEFIDTDTEQIKLINELEVGKTYETVITNGSGLYRYRINDLVKVHSYFNQLPNLEFVGKSNMVSDLVGEKLSEPTVSAALSIVIAEKNLQSQVLFLSPCSSHNVSFYTLYTNDKTISPNIADIVDKELHRVFYYAHARNYNQLGKPKIYLLSLRGTESYFELFTNNSIRGTSKFFGLNKELNLFETLEGEFIN